MARLPNVISSPNQDLGQRFCFLGEFENGFYDSEYNVPKAPLIFPGQLLAPGQALKKLFLALDVLPGLNLPCRKRRILK